MKPAIKTRATFNTVIFLSIFFAIAVCFVALIHVEIVLQAHGHTLQILSQEKEKNLELLNVVHRHEAAIDLLLKTFRSNSDESKLLHSLNFVLSVCIVGYKWQTIVDKMLFRRRVFHLQHTSMALSH